MRIKNTFLGAKMDKDTDERLLKNSEYRHAENIRISSSEAEDTGAVENSFGTECAYNLTGVTNAYCIGSVVDESNGLIYELVTSDEYDFIIEFSSDTGEVIVLQDTKGRILNFDKEFLITGINIINSEDINLKQLSWSGDLNPPRKIYIESSKAFSIDGFDVEDISVIKRPPVTEPSVLPIYDGTIKENNLDSAYYTFSFRYIYEGNEYSSNSFYSPIIYSSNSKNSYSSINAIDVTVNTGDSRVKGIEILYKDLNSSSVYVIKTINKEKDSIADSSDYTYRFKNDKIYTVLSTEQSSLIYNNVPLRAKTQDFIGNRLFYFNYEENYDLVDSEGAELSVDYTIDKYYPTFSVPVSYTYTYSDLFLFSTARTINIDFTGAVFTKDQALSFNLFFGDKYIVNYEYHLYEYFLTKNYSTIQEVLDDGLYEWLEEAFASDNTGVNISITGDILSLNLTLGFFATVDTPHTISTYDWLNLTYKSEREQSFGIVYYDDYNRSSPVLVTDDNSVIFETIKNNRIGQEVGRVKININHKPPVWATKYKIVRFKSNYNYEIGVDSDLFKLTDVNGVVTYYMGIDDEEVDKFKVDSIIDYRGQASGYVAETDLKFKIVEVSETVVLIPDLTGANIPNTMLKLFLYSGDLTGLNAVATGWDAPNDVSSLYTDSYYYVTGEKSKGLDIYYEVPQTFLIGGGIHLGNIQDQVLDTTPAIVELEDGDSYLQNFNLESYKIRNKFNADKFDNVENIRPNTTSELYKKSEKAASITYSDVFNEFVSYNGLSTFNLSKINYRDLDLKYGTIQVGEGRYGDIFIAQEHRLSKVLFDRDLLTNADGTGSLTATNKILGNQIYIPIDNGISIHPESFKRYDNTMLFTDAFRGEVIMVKGDSIGKISRLGMDSYFKDKLKENINSKIIGGYNPDTDEYILTMGGETVGFNILTSSWTSFYSYIPENMLHLKGDFYSIKEGSIHLHSGSAGNYNTFYGVNYPSRLSFVVNDEPSTIKEIKSLCLEGNTPWDVELTSYISNMDDYTRSTIEISEFYKKEGLWYAYTRRNECEEQLDSKSAYGIGEVIGVAADSVLVKGGSSLLTTDDRILKDDLSTVGEVVTSSTVDGFTTIALTSLGTIANGDFILGMKNPRVEGSNLRGYSIKLKLDIITSDKVELFAVNSEVIKSFS